MNRLYETDKAIIKYFQKFAHFTQRIFGISALHWERFFFALSVFAAIICMKKFAIVLASLDLVYSVFRKKNSNNRGDIINWKESEAIPRFACIVVCIVGLPIDIITHDFWFEFVIVGGLFRQCNDLPKSPSKMRVFLGNVFGSMSDTVGVTNE